MHKTLSLLLRDATQLRNYVLHGYWHRPPYWEANADFKAIVEEEAEKCAHEAIECDREAKRLADELNSLPGFKLFGNGSLKAQKDELAKCIEKATDDAKRLREKRGKNNHTQYRRL